jgi:hypothetical protein
LADLNTSDVVLVGSAVERLRQMFDVLCLYTQRFDLIEIEDHLKRIFDLILSSTVFDTFSQILDSADDIKIAPIKLEVLRCFGLLSIG